MLANEVPLIDSQQEPKHEHALAFSDMSAGATDTDALLPDESNAGKTRQRRSAASADAQSATSTAAPLTDADIDAAYVRDLRDALSGWVDYEKARAHAGDAYEILQGVLDHYDQPLSDAFVTTLDLSLIEDERFFDEAALLYYQLKKGGEREGNSSSAASSSVRLRSEFLDALRVAAARHNSLDRLLAPPTGDATATSSATPPHFDGFAVCHALGKSFEDLLNSPGISSDPAFASTSAEQKRALLSAKFAQMGESTQYRIGTPQQSLASVLIRIAKYRDEAPPGQFANDEALLKEFKRVEDAWASDRTIFPLHPRILFAIHLAQSSGVDLLSTEELSQRYERIMARAVKLSERGDWDARLWLQSIPAKFNGRTPADSRFWMHRGVSIKREALLATFEALRRMSLRSETPPGVNPQKVWDFAEQIKQEGLLDGEVLLGDDWKEKVAVLLGYASERLCAVFCMPPRFSRSDAARDILERYGMGEAEMDRGRSYTLTADKPNLSETRFGDRVEEFLDRADWGGINGRAMRVAGRTIYPRDELQAAEEAFNRNLTSNEWVRVKAKENWRTRPGIRTKAMEEAEAQRISQNYRAETENHRAWMRGFDAWINTVPIIGSVYNIEEGIRNRDVGQALLGVLFLGLDVLDMTGGGEHPHANSGGEVRLKSMPAHRRAAVGDLHYVTTKLGADTVRVIGAVEGRAAVPEFKQLDGNVPPEYRPLATRVRNGEAGVKWGDYDVVHIVNEDRIVPVKHEGGSYHEIDWNTGHRARNSRLIRRDPETRSFRTDGGLSGGMQPVDSIGQPIADRFTTKQVEQAMLEATDATVHDFESRFTECFSAIPTRANALENWDVKAFFTRLYTHSDTFRRLFNRYYATTSRGMRRWKLLFGAAGEPGNFAHAIHSQRSIELPMESQFGDQKMMTAAGKVPTTKENVVLHETLHMLTSLKDLPAHGSAHVKTSTEQGAIVWLTDRILSEAGFVANERVMYKELPDGEQLTLRDAIKDAHLVNVHLDPVFDARRPPVTAETLVEEVPVKDRTTVKQWRQVQQRIGGASKSESVTSLRTKFEQHFDLSSPGAGLSALEPDPMKNVKQVLERFLRKSETFRALVQTMPEPPAESSGRWKFVFDADAAPKNPATGQALSGVEDMRKQIYFFDDQASYLTENGLRYVEFERKVASALIHAMTDLKVPQAQAYKNRGAAARLVDKVLAESGYHHPKQMAAALASPNDASRSALRSHLTSSRRSAAVEDAYMA